jgi:hypothetical protein
MINSGYDPEAWKTQLNPASNFKFSSAMKSRKNVLQQNHTCRTFQVLISVVSFISFLVISNGSEAQEYMPAKDVPAKYVPDTRIDNMGYWRRMAELGLVPVEPVKPAPASIQRSSKLSAPGIATYDSPDVRVTETNSLQSENSVFIDPENGLRLLNSNNSHPAPYIGTQFGADALQSEDGGSTWGGTIQGAGGYNFGDPTTAISRTGRMYVGYIYSGGGQGISYSDDNGQTWKKRGVAAAPGGVGSILDKNHLWIDNSLTSPYTTYMYDGWTVIGGGSNGSGHLQVTRSMDGGLAWQNPVTISNNVAAGSHNQGINLHTGPEGEVYAVWAVYDKWPANEKALGFARSFTGGHTWQPAKRIINNIKGIRLQGVNKLMRVNSFPSMAVDISNGPDRGSIYVVWANYGEPGINEGVSIDIYMMKSKDKGDTWSEPLKINQDEPGLGRQHYFPWITCDPENGNLAVVFYDDRNVPDDMCETWVAVSKNGGISWQDFRVSDVAFTPAPLTGMSDNYFGDYLGITSKGGMVYPCWTDNRTGEAMGYVSPFRIGPPPGQPYIDYYTHLVNDTLSGNGNAKAEAGETIALSLTMRNIGDEADSSVNVTLSCDSPYVQILNDNQYFGDFGAGELKNIPQTFLIKLSDSTPDGHELVFTLTSRNHADSIFQSSMVLLPHAPHLAIGPLFVIDNGGNGNNQPDPGESVILRSVLTNTGDYYVASAISRLSTTQPFIQIINPEVISEQLSPGESDTVFWNVEIAGSVEAGTSAGFTDSLSYSGQRDKRLFLKKIGVLTEDWESGGLSKMAWKTGGNKSWNINNFKVYEGTFSLRSGYIDDLDTSSLYITLNLAADDSISFYRKVSSELSYDFLNFSIDGMKVGQWSGEKDWKRVSFPVPAGVHTLQWDYAKDLGLSIGYDAAWIDFIEFPVQQRTTANAGADARICSGNSFQPDAIATNYLTLKWSTSGTGFFNDPGIINTIYLPSPSDIEAGSVQLILTLTGYSYGETVKDTLVLTFAPKPVLYAGPDTYTCTGEVFTTSAAATNYFSVNWITSGDGIFSNPDSILTVYTPGPEDILKKKARLIINIKGEDVCARLYDTLALNIYPGFTAELNGDTTICKGDTTFLNLQLNGQGPWRIYLSDGSSINLLKPELILPVSPDVTTIYSVDSITNASGCTFRTKLKAQVDVLQPPLTEMLGPAESCREKQVIIQVKTDSAAVYRWTPGNAATHFINPLITGNVGEIKKYCVHVTGTNGCSTSDSLQLKIVTECYEKKAGEMDVRYYPNPTNGDFTLVLSSAVAETANVSIRSMDNKLVYVQENIKVLGVNTLSINLESVAQGTYLIHISCGSGELKDKIVIKK